MDIQHKPFSEINLADPFFDSLKADYQEFETWFIKKQNHNSKAFIMESDTGLEAFLFLKSEEGSLTDITPNLPPLKRLKVGTFKVNPHGTRLGERFIKKIFDYAIKYDFPEAYVTIFAKHDYLLQLLERYGFKRIGTKTTANGVELVLVKNFTSLTGDTLFDYPLFNPAKANKYLLSIYPSYHTRLFPDSILNNENFDIIQDVSHTNSIHKVYICWMNVSAIQPDDLLIIYRTSDQSGRAYYRSVATSVCIVEEVRKSNSFVNVDEFLAYTQRYSIFSEEELREWYAKGNAYVIKMTYNAAFSRRLTRKVLIEEIGLKAEAYWGFMSLSDEHFNHILSRGGVNESLIVDQA